MFNHGAALKTSKSGARFGMINYRALNMFSNLKGSCVKGGLYMYIKGMRACSWSVPEKGWYEGMFMVCT